MVRLSPADAPVSRRSLLAGAATFVETPLAVAGPAQAARPIQVGTQAFYAVLAKLGGATLVGEAASLPADLSVDQAVDG